MPDKSKTRQQLLSQMTEIVVGNVETMPPDERAERVAAFRKAIKGDEKTALSRPKAPRTFGNPRKSRRSRA
ncbi:MAG TPA: hypothetical protein VLA42_11410 [Verrucomicrobiae bacterium]|nr:hypothetical protein [Verrucomicrobiae bacterium]